MPSIISAFNYCQVAYKTLPISKDNGQKYLT